MQRDHREYQINKFVLNALLQAGAVTRCEHHGDVLLHNDDAGAENRARFLATDWLERDGGIGNGCPECARLEDG